MLKKYQKSKKDFNLKQEFETFRGFFKIVGKSFFRSPRGILFLYIVPPFFMILFYFLLGNSYTTDQKISLLFTYLLLPGLTIFSSLAPALVGWKNSVLLRRIDTTGAKKSVFLLALWTFYFLAGLSGVLCQFILALALGNTLFVNRLPEVNWGYLLLGIFFTIILAVVLATLLAGIFNNEGVMQGVVMIVYFLSIFLSGVIFNPGMYEQNEVIRIITYFVPQKYPSFLILLAQDPHGLDGTFNNANPDHPDFTAAWQLIVASLSLIIVFMVGGSLTFKLTIKK